MSRELLDEQKAYYRARAGEYDEWFLRQGRYDLGVESNARWFSEIEAVRSRLAALGPVRRALELACGTGLATELLSAQAERVVAVDASPQMLSLNRARAQGGNVDFVEADLFTWQPDEEFDLVFFSFWLSHVPPDRFAAFWSMVRRALAPGGSVFLWDSLYDPSSIPQDHRLGSPEDTTVRRRLNDGREFEIVKLFYTPENLSARLFEIGWLSDLQATPTHFLYGTATPNRELGDAGRGPQRPVGPGSGSGSGSRRPRRHKHFGWGMLQACPTRTRSRCSPCS